MAFEILQTCVLLEDPVTEPVCQKCLATVRFIRSILDPATGRSVRIFECDDCGQRTWDD
jgi:hypothetical protein